jgi:DNA-binding response OmpR family regulator
MTDSTLNDATVLVVDDETSLADLYAHWLSEDYEVLTAYGGEQALEKITDDVDVVLLDRRMPELSGDEVLERIRERNYDVRVAMVTAVDPDFDIIDMQCDEYLVKSVTREDLVETVEFLLKLDEYNEKQNELTAKKIRRNVLEVEKTKEELNSSQAFADLQAEIASLEEELGEMTEELDDEALDRRT